MSVLKLPIVVTTVSIVFDFDTFISELDWDTQWSNILILKVDYPVNKILICSIQSFYCAHHFSIWASRNCHGPLTPLHIDKDYGISQIMLISVPENTACLNVIFVYSLVAWPSEEHLFLPAKCHQLPASHRIWTQSRKMNPSQQRNVFRSAIWT